MDNDPRASVDVYNVVDKDGNIVDQLRYPKGGSLYEGAKSNRDAGITNTVYRSNSPDKEQYEPLFSEEDVRAASSISLDKNTGKITVTAPSMALKNEVFKKTYDEALKIISQNYKLNPDYAYKLMADSDEEKTSEEWIDDFNSDFGDVVAGAVAREEEKRKVKEKDGVDLSDEDVTKMYSIALEYRDLDGKTVQVKDETIQSLPERIKNLNAFSNLEGWDEDSHGVTWGNLKKVWDREKTKDEDIHEVFDAVDDYFTQGDFSNPSEYAEMVAFREFINGKDPSTAFLRGVVETTGEVLYGAIVGLADPSLDILSDIEAISNVKFNGKSVVKDIIEPAYEELKDERVRLLRQVNDKEAAAFATTAELVGLSEDIALSVLVGNLVAARVAKLPSKVIKIFEKYGATANELSKVRVATLLASEGADFTAAAKSIYVGTDIALNFMKASKAAETMAAAISRVIKLKAGATAIGAAVRVADVLAQAAVDVALSDRRMFRTLMTSNDTEAKGWALRQLALNAAGEVTGVGAARFLKDFGSSDVGLVLQTKTVPYISRMKANVGQLADDLKTAIHGGNPDWLLDTTNKLRDAADAKTGRWYSKYVYNAAGSAERRLRNLAERRILRQANYNIGELAGTVRGRTWEETLEAARRVKGKMVDELAEAQNLINTMYRGDVTALVYRFLRDDERLAGAETAYLRALDRVVKAERAAGLGSSVRPISIGEGESKFVYNVISDETNAYVLGQYRIKRAEATIALSRNPDDVAGAKKELEHWSEIVNKFREEKPQELINAADELLGRAKQFSAKTQDLRVRMGVLSEKRLNDLRTSGFFDDGYVRLQRAKTWGQYRKEGGKLRLTELRDEQEFGWGDTDPFQDISIVLFDDLNDVARQVYRKKMVDSLRGIGVKVDTVVDGDTSRVVSEVNRVKKLAMKDLEHNTTSAVKATKSAIYDNFFEKKKGQFFIDTATKDVVSSKVGTTKARTKALKVTRNDRHELFTELLPDSDIDSLVLSDPRSAFNVAVTDEESFQRFYKELDSKTKRWLDDRFKRETGRLYGIPIKPRKVKSGTPELKVSDEDIEAISLALGKEAKVRARDVASYENLSKIIDDDPSFISQLKRVYAEKNFGDTLDDQILDAKRFKAVFDADTLYKDNLARLKEMRRKYDLPELNANVDRQVDEFIDDVVSANTDNPEVKQAITALADDLTSGDDLLEYSSLQSMYRHRKHIKNQFYDRANKTFNEALTKNMRDKYGADKKALSRKKQQVNKMANEWANETTEMLMTRIEERYGAAVNKLMQQNSPLVDEKTRKEVFKHISELNKEITEAIKTPNVIKSYDAFGQEEYIELSPTIADMFTSMPRPIRRGPFGELQAAFVRLFRFGTTGGLVPGSLVSQGFRDTGNAVVVGDAMKGAERVKDELARLFGDRFAEEYQKNIPDVWQTLLKKSEETGEDVNRLIAERELRLGAENVSRQQEANIYQLGREAKVWRNERGIYEESWMERARDWIDEKQKSLEKLNTIREVALRKRVYNNNLLKGMKQGLSVQQARNLAEFMQAEATTNFVRQSYHLANLSKTVPYLSAAINGQKSFWRLMSWDPIGVTTRIIGGYVVPVIALTNMSLSTEENKRIYKQIPEYEKADNLVFVLDGQILSIPIPQEISSFVTPVQHMIETMQGENDSGFAELMANDLLGMSPVDLSGFMNLDADKLVEDNVFENHLVPGFMKAASTLMPPLVKTGFILATGIDPYTMKRVSRNNVTTDPETGEQILMDYTAGSAAMAIGGAFGSYMSPGMAEKVLTNLIGQGNTLLLNGIFSLAGSIVDPDKNFLTDGAGKVIEDYVTNATKRLTVERYREESNAAWNRAVARLWEEKNSLLADKSYQADLSALAKSDLSDEARKTITSRINSRRQEFMQKVLDTANRLVSEYDGTFDRNKFASVVSLMNLDTDSENQLPQNEWATYLSSQERQINKAAAIETMANMGFSGPDDGSIFGYYSEDKDGKVTIKYNSPLSILNFQRTERQQDATAFASIYKIINDTSLHGGGTLYDEMQAYDKQIQAIYDKKKKTKQDYANIEQLQINWNSHVAALVAPVISQMTPEAAINNKRVRDLLYTYIYVPSSYATNNRGRYVSLGDDGSKKAAYYDSFIKRMFGINDPYKGQY